jgi:pilin isopeptide linkage protein
MKLKKFFAGVLAAAMMLTVGATAAFAEEEAAPITSVDVKKVYTLNGAGISPKETFTFDIARKEVSNAGTGVTNDNMPVPSIGSAAYTVEDGAKADGNSKNVTIDFTKDGQLIYNAVGVYDYTVSENAGKTLGVAYDTKTYTMRVVVANGETRGTYKINSVKFIDSATKQKADTVSFENTYSANTLSVSKNVIGALGDMAKDFQFHVSFANDTEKTWTDAITVKKTNQNGETSTITLDEDGGFTLKDDETVVFENVPADLTYTVSENDYTADGYTTKLNNVEKRDSGNVTMTATAASCAFENSKGGTIDTGVILDNAPYIALLAIVAIGGVALMLNKRRRDEE